MPLRLATSLKFSALMSLTLPSKTISRTAGPQTLNDFSNSQHFTFPFVNHWVYSLILGVNLTHKLLFHPFSPCNSSPGNHRDRLGSRARHYRCEIISAETNEPGPSEQFPSVELLISQLPLTGLVICLKITRSKASILASFHKMPEVHNVAFGLSGHLRSCPLCCPHILRFRNSG